MNGTQLLELYNQHGGIARIHVHPVRGGWANTVVCWDGYMRRQTAREDRMLAKMPAANISLAKRQLSIARTSTEQPEGAAAQPEQEER